MMCAKPASTDGDSSSRRRIQRLRLPRSGKHMDMKDLKVALDIILRPSLQLWKLAVGGSIVPAAKPPQKSVVLGDDASSAFSMTPKKKVRFDEQPARISRRRFFGRCSKDSIPSPPRPCLVIREHDDVVRHEPSRPPDVTDCLSVYEDCLSDYAGFLIDLQVLDGDDRVETQSLIRRSDFYETESGIATFDQTGYANYCLTRWLDKQHEEVQAQQKLVFEDPILLPWPSRTLSPPSGSSTPNVVRPVPLPRTSVSRPPQSLPLRIWKHAEDELHNAVFVLIVGLFIHICLFLFLLYDILTRGLIPSDE